MFPRIDLPNPSLQAKRLKSLLQLALTGALSCLLLNQSQGTPIQWTGGSTSGSAQYHLDFERINTDSDGTVFLGLLEDLRDRQWIGSEFQADYGISFESSIEPTTSTHKPNESGDFSGATATDYPRDVFYSWASGGLFGPGMTTYDSNTGSWGHGALSNLNNESQNGGWIDIHFDDPITRFGLNFITGSSSLVLQVNGQTFNFPSALPWDLNDFAGVIDTSGFTEIRISSLGGGAFFVDNFLWDERRDEIPEPTTVTLLSLGIGALTARHRKGLRRLV